MPLTDNFMESYRSCCKDSQTRLKVLMAAGHDQSLNLNPDRLEAEDWQPLMKALRSDRKLHSLAIRSEWTGEGHRYRGERVKPAFHKPAIIDELVDSVVVCMKRSDILSTLQLRSLPLTRRHIYSLADGIRTCVSLQNLLLTRFPLDDDGLETLYESIYPHTGLTNVDLTGCGLTGRGACIVAKIIRTQRLARYSETWKQSLRYREPESDLYPGVRRFTLNDNPGIGDEGYLAITHELIDDLWVKALDVQNCGLTEASGEHTMSLLGVNETVAVLDLARNSGVSYDTKSKIQRMLAHRRTDDGEPSDDNVSGRRRFTEVHLQSYDWLEEDSDATERFRSSRKPNSELSADRGVRNASCSHLTVELHQTKRVLDDTKRCLNEEREKRERLESEKKMQKKKLAEKFAKEWNKRKRAEKERDRLKDELNSYLSEGHSGIVGSNKSSSGSSSGHTKKNRSKKAGSKTLLSSTSEKGTRTKASKKKVAPESSKRPGKDYKVSNTDQVHIIQQNLDRLNFNAVEKAPHPSDSESDENEQDVASTDNEKDPRDLSPISRSQWIFDKLMTGKSRGSVKCKTDHPFDSKPKQDVKV